MYGNLISHVSTAIRLLQLSFLHLLQSLRYPRFSWYLWGILNTLFPSCNNHVFRIRLSSHCYIVDIGRNQNKNRQDRYCESCTTQQNVLNIQLKKEIAKLIVLHVQLTKYFLTTSAVRTQHIPFQVALGKYIQHAEIMNYLLDHMQKYLSCLCQKS